SRPTSRVASALATSKREGPTSRAFMDAEVSSTSTTLRAPSPVTVTAGRASATDSARRARIWRIRSGSRWSRWKKADASRSRSDGSQEQARHPSLAPTDLEEIEQDERQDQRREGKRKRREEAHT